MDVLTRSPRPFSLEVIDVDAAIEVVDFLGVLDMPLADQDRVGGPFSWRRPAQLRTGRECSDRARWRTIAESLSGGGGMR
jgi:hypothetical protein